MTATYTAGATEVACPLTAASAIPLRAPATSSGSESPARRARRRAPRPARRFRRRARSQQSCSRWERWNSSRADIAILLPASRKSKIESERTWYTRTEPRSRTPRVDRAGTSLERAYSSKPSMYSRPGPARSAGRACAALRHTTRRARASREVDHAQHALLASSIRLPIVALEEQPERAFAKQSGSTCGVRLAPRTRRHCGCAPRRAAARRPDRRGTDGSPSRGTGRSAGIARRGCAGNGDPHRGPQARCRHGAPSVSPRRVSPRPRGKSRTTGASAALELRRALLDERLDALAEVVASSAGGRRRGPRARGRGASGPS